MKGAGREGKIERKWLSNKVGRSKGTNKEKEGMVLLNRVKNNIKKSLIFYNKIKKGTSHR